MNKPKVYIDGQEGTTIFRIIPGLSREGSARITEDPEHDPTGGHQKP